MAASAQHPPISSAPCASPFSSSRKRRASPPPDPSAPLSLSPPSSWATSSLIPTSTTLQPAKRRRPNLANGFSSLSIKPRIHRGTSPLPSYEESQASRHQVDDEDEERSFGSDDVCVQELPSPSRLGRPRWSMPNRGSSSSASSVSTDRDAYDSDSTFHLPSTSRTVTTQQADREQPESTNDTVDNVLIEDITPIQGRNQRRREEEMNTNLGRKRRKADVGDMDVDMDDMINQSEDEDTASTDLDIEVIVRQKDRKRRTKTRWHEPEKDRIVVTSLGSSSRSGSSEGSLSPESDRLLSQPGDQGFTLNPSLFTHLLNAQREQTVVKKPERSLILYRPASVSPSAEAVKKWQRSPGVVYYGEGRVDEVDDDTFIEEEMQGDVINGSSEGPMAETMDIEMV